MPVQCSSLLHLDTFSFFVVVFFCCCLEHCQALQKQNLSLVKSVIEGTIHCKPGAAELLVQEVYSILTNKRYGRLGASAAACHQEPIRLLKLGLIRLISRHQAASQSKVGNSGWLDDLLWSRRQTARVKTVYCLGCHETLPKRILVWPSMLKQSPENLASMQEKKKNTNFKCVHLEELHCKELLRSSWCLQIWFSAVQTYHCYMRHTHDTAHRNWVQDVILL